MSKIYDDSTIRAEDIKTIEGWERFDSKYFNIKFLFVVENGDSTTYNEVEYINKVGTYVIQVSPKKEAIMINGAQWKFCWTGDGDQYEYISIGSLMVGNVKLVVSNVMATVELPYKNSNYSITFASIAPDVNYNGSGTASGGEKNKYFPNLYDGNVAKVKLSLDGTNYNSELVQMQNIGDTIVYYEVSSDPNYDPVYGQFTVSIKPAELTLSFSEVSQIYGDAKMDAGDIVATGKVSCEANSTEDTTWANALLSQIFTLRVGASGTVYNGKEYLDAGKYDILAVVNTEWQNRVSATVKYKDDNNIGAYVVNAKPVHITWSNTSSYYDGQTGHRSVANVATSELVAKDQANNLTLTPTVSLKDGGSVVSAGTYDVKVDFHNSNYTCTDEELANGAFTINPRPISVTLFDRNRTYGEGDSASVTWSNYLKNFDSTIDVDGVFSTVLANGLNDGKAPLVDLASSIFKLSIGTTADDYTSGDSADPTFVASDRYFKVNENTGYVLTIELIDSDNSNYVLVNSVSAKLYVHPAKILFTETSLESKSYNGAEQTIAIDNDKLKERMSGYEKANYDTLFANGAIKAEYKVDAPSAYATSGYTTDLKLKQATTYEISYKITAPNHEVREGSVRIQINAVDVYIDFTPYDGARYGDAIPDSDTLKSLLKVKFYSSADKASEFAFADEISVRLLGGGGGDDTLSGDKVMPGSYSASYVRDAVVENYNVHYTSRNGADSNINVYTIKQKELHIIWKQTGAGWESDGLTFTYNGSPLSVKPVADPADIVSGDSITPADPTWDKSGGNVGTYNATTSLSSQQNREKYTIVNATQEFTIIPRTIKVQIKNQTATYGNASTVPLGTSLINPDSADALWGYASGSLQFVNGEYTNFKLTSDAQNPTGEAKYVDVGDYDIIVEAVTKGSQADQNYTFEIVKDGVEGESGFNATFSITRATIHYTGRQFNIKYDFADTSNNTEKNYVTQNQVRARISTTVGTPTSEFNIEMTNLVPWTAELDGVDGTYGDTLGWNEIEETAPATAVGLYYLFVKITHETNYETFYSKIEVNIQTDWVSITIIGDGIKASYGETTHSSSAIFQELKEQITYIGGIVNTETNQEADRDYALKKLEEYVNNNQIEFFVGMGDTITQMTTNGDFGDYSIFIKVLDSSLNTYFRFLDEKNESGTDKPTTNINKYHVGKRVVQMNWGKDGSMDEVYGAHSDSLTDPSASHIYSVKNPMPGDNVRVTVTYLKKENGVWVPLPQGEHTLEVGEYLARVTAVSHDNYEVPTGDGNWLEQKFEITKKSLTIKLMDRNDLSYGAPNATKDNINNFLNVQVAGITRYNILNGDTFAYDDAVTDVFRFALDFTLESGYTYLHAGDYTITYDKSFVNPNYDITFQEGTFTINKASADNVHYTQAQLNNVKYNGKNFSLIQDDILDRITLIGDGVKLLNAYQTIKFYCRLQGDTDFTENLSVKDAKTYTVDIKIEAPDHEVQTITGINFTIQQAVVKISMTQTDKTYGDTLADMLNKAGLSSTSTLNDWLKKKCNIKLSYTGTIEGINEDFEFIVIDSAVDPDNLTGVTQLVPGTSHNVGTYRVYVNIDKLNGNYSFDFEQKAGATFKCNANAYRIVPRDAQVTWKSDSEVVVSGNFKPEYTGAPIVLAPYVTDIADNQEKQLDATGRNTNVGAGTAKVSVDKTNADNLWMNNYNFIGDTFNYEILPKSVKVTINDLSVGYGQEESKRSFWVDLNDVNRFTSDTQLIGSPIRLFVNASTTKEYLGATTYTIQGKCNSDNYKVEFTTGTLTITPADINNNNEKSHSQPYNGGDFVANVKQLLIDGNYYTLAGDMTWNDATVTYNVADATIQGIGTKEVEYTIKLANHVDIKGTIEIAVTQALLVANVTKGASSVYGSKVLSSAQLFKYVTLDTDNSTLTTVKLDSIIRLSVNVDDTYSDRLLNRGSYSLTYEWLDESYKALYNIRLNNNVIGVYEVTPKAISFVWNYDENTKFVYNGSGHRVEAVFNGVISDDDVKIGYYNNASAVNAGTYKASAQGLIGEDSSNYELDSTSTLEWRIWPKEIDVEWTAGDFTYNGAPHTSAIQKMAAAKTSDLVAGDVCGINVNVEWDDRIYAGKHMAEASSTNPNYVVKKATATFEFEIKKAMIYITWSDDVLYYNGELQAPKAMIEGNQLVAGDVCNITVEGAQRNVKTSGNYVATATIDNPNYAVVSSSASTAFNIAPKAITFNWDGTNTNLVYIGAPQAPRPNAIGLVAGDEVEFAFDGMQENVGKDYIATVTGIKGNANYVIDWDSQTAVATVTFSIGKGVNGFKEEGFKLPAILDQLPWIDSAPEVKFGQDNLVVKYYSDKNLTKEVTNIDKAGEGKYWVTVFVAGTENYDDFYQVFEVEVQGNLNIAIIILASVASVLLLAGALIVVLTTNKSGKKNKQEEGGAE
ncbi:MAG: hypothetical protein K2I46_06175 [Clostridia bacterium]|nr:hypothetical protein [Clostridia bacterium]